MAQLKKILVHTTAGSNYPRVQNKGYFFFLLMKSITHEIDHNREKKVMSRPHLEFFLSVIVFRNNITLSIASKKMWEMIP